MILLLKGLERCWKHGIENVINIFLPRQLENDERAMLGLSPAKNNNNHVSKLPSESAESTDSDISSVDGLNDGIDTSDGFDYASFEVWGEIIRDWEENMRRRPRFIRDLTHKGIPEAMRCIVWQYFTGAWESSLVGKYADLIQVSDAWYCMLLSLINVGETPPSLCLPLR